MNKPKMHKTSIDLDAESRQEIVALLNRQLADTSDLFTGVSRGLDKSLWFLEAHLQTY